MKTLKILTIIAVTSTASLVASNTNQQGDCINRHNVAINSHIPKTKVNKKHNRRNSSRKINHLLRKLDLTETQKRQLKEIRKEMRQARKIQREKFRGSMDLKKIISVDGFDKSGFILSSENIANEAVRTRAEMIEKFVAVLTPEQRIELVERLNRKGKGKKHQ